MDIISVIVPIYRVEPYLEKCIQSIQNQTYTNLQIILVNDGSDDNCPQICDLYAQSDRRIKVIHKKNGGPDSARKAGMQIADGKYVGYVDGDDWIEPEMYEKLISYAKIYDVDVVESGVIDSYKSHEKKRVASLEEGCYKRKKFVEKIESRLLYSGHFFEHGISPYLWSKLFLREKIVKYQMMEGLINEVQDDIITSLPCIAKSKSIYISHECYYHYRVRIDSLKRKYIKDEMVNFFDYHKDYYSRFNGTMLVSESDRQIKYYTMYWLLFKTPFIFDCGQTDIFLIPYGGIRIQNKIILYGAGASGIHLENYIRNVDGSNIVCWMDINHEDFPETMNVKDPEEIVNYDYDYVIISILREKSVESAKEDLIKLGVAEEKILWLEQKYIDNPDILLSRVAYQGERLITKH